MNNNETRFVILKWNKTLPTFALLLASFNGFNQTQAEMNKTAYTAYEESDKRLNEVYQLILSEYKLDTAFINSLKKSQRIWIQFRDAELEMKYPNYKDRNYGSVYPTCRAFYLKELTDKRIETLQVWIDGIEEGELCNGFVKMVEN